MLKFYLLPVAAGLLFIATACEKRHDPNNGTILRRSIRENTDSIVITNYVYNETGRLVRLQITTHPSTIYEINEALLLQYNNAGLLVKSYNAEAGNSSYNIQEYSYRNNDTIDVLFTPYRWTPPSHTRQVILDNNRRVISDSMRAINANVVTYYSFTYDAADNAATEKYGIVENGITRDDYELSYTYDARPNPFKTFGLPYYLATRDVKAFNTNNVQSWSEGSLRYTWQYSYNTSGLPLESVLPVASGKMKYNFYYR